MRPYLAVLRARFSALLQYRAAAMAGLATQLFWGLMRIMVLEAFTRSSTGPHPMSHREMTGYVWLGQATLAILPWNNDKDVQNQVRSGAVAYELVRPVDLYWLWYARHVAMRTAPTVLRAVPLFAIAMLCFGMPPPANIAAGAAWLAATAGAVLLSAAICNLSAAAQFWTVSGQGVHYLLSSLVWVASGLAVPLPFFPEFLQPLLRALPFGGVMDLPFRLYLGHLPASALPAVLWHQGVWTLLVIAAGRMLASAGRSRLVVQGG